jgi:hypothetical protein
MAFAYNRKDDREGDGVRSALQFRQSLI